MAFLPPPSTHRHSAFSMVEVLVAASIIGILAVMLFPVGKGILDRAATSKSMSNLRQIGLGAAAYVSDHDGYLPGKDFNDSSTLWIYKIYELVYNKPIPSPFFDPQDTGANLKNTIFFSPNLKPSEPTPWRSYGWNSYLHILGRSPLKLSAIPNPSRVILCGDAQNASTLYVNQVSYRNQDKALMLMADQHVEQMSKKDVPTSDYDPMWRPVP